ncbi:Predicted naringenin-chalcone synthase [Microbacterium sp. C448]|uniref:type III polyketide synthase n=1 Tax=Microbacterium sp. C448 TaxID=1177594 RepID=UPI0003DE3EDE|nr:type III polyketide synthase [Microbacterium sp. C448]CDK00061.1 Predicted naringenin-chalcone synthase [Microbacterium sp. C448]
MPAHILGIGTAVPTPVLPQTAVRDLFLAQPGVERLTARLIGAAFDQSAIDTRHTVLAELAEHSAEPSAFLDADTRQVLSPLTGTRNDVYRREAPPLFERAARDALARADVEASAITHVVTASCTGFYAPGPDYRLVRDLGLRTTVERDHLGFVGCAAAFPALRQAARICAADPNAVVLVVCGEICSIHLRASADPEQIVASAVFADGAAAAVVSAQPSLDAPSLELEGFATALTSEGEDDKRWIIGDHGFEMTLTAEVPRIVGREVRDALAPVLSRAGHVDRWLVHPGGRSILDRFEAALELPADALELSRDVLRRFGNMSSATVLFIMARMLEDPALADGSRAIGVAFGPGLTVESALLTARVPTAAVVEAAAGVDAAGADDPVELEREPEPVALR